MRITKGSFLVAAVSALFAAKAYAVDCTATFHYADNTSNTVTATCPGVGEVSGCTCSYSNSGTGYQAFSSDCCETTPEGTVCSGYPDTVGSWVSDITSCETFLS